MLRSPVVLLGTLLVGALAFAGPEDGVHWVGSLEEAFRQAKERGALIFIAEVIDNEVDNDTQKAEYANPAFIKASRDFVCLFACPMTQHGTVTVEVDGQKVRRCRIAPTITCQEHLAIWNELRKNYADLNMASNGDTKIPFHFVIDADGKVVMKVLNGTVEGGFGVVPTAVFLEAFKLLLREHGKPISSDEYRALTKKLEEAEAARKAGDVRKALKILNEVIEANEKTSLADRARKMREEIAEEARGRLDEALAGIEKDPIGAILELEELAKEFKGTEIGKSAQAKVDELRDDPKVKKLMSQAAERRAAEKALAEAEKAVAAKKYMKALKLLDSLAKKYEGKPVGEKAKARAEELRGDEEIMKIAREQEAEKYCRGWLSMGRSFAANGMTAKARAQFQKIIDRFPGTSYAEEAAKELEKLK